jgi:hypothetical protein
VTSQDTPNISTRLHANMSFLCQRKSTSSLSCLGFKPAPILMVLTGSSVSICNSLASLAALKVLNEEGMARLVEVGGAWRLCSLSLIMTTEVATNSMFFTIQRSLSFGLRGDDPCGPRYLELEVGVARDGHELDVT